MHESAQFRERIESLADRADRVRSEFTPPADPPDHDRAMDLLREGAGPAVSLYIEARTGGQLVQFPLAEYRALEGAMNTYLELYAACYGVEIDADWTIREAAELLVDTHNIRAVAVMLTHVPADAKPAGANG